MIRLAIPSVQPGRFDVIDFPVLVVEDVDDIRKRYIVSLERAGFQAEGAGTRSEALTKIKKQTYSVAVVDINLQDARVDVGDRSGHLIVRKIKEMNEGTKCLIVTAQKDMESGAESFRAGMDDILLKNEIGDNLSILVEKVKDLKEQVKIDPLGSGSLKHLHAYLSAPQDRSHWEALMGSQLGLDSARFYEVISSAFDRVLPVRRLVNSNYSLKQHVSDKSYSGVFWSRAIGCAVEVWIWKDGDGPKVDNESSMLVERKKSGINICVLRIPNLDVNEFDETVER